MADTSGLEGDAGCPCIQGRIPGLKEVKVKVEVEGKVVQISAERSAKKEEKKDK